MGNFKLSVKLKREYIQKEVDNIFFKLGLLMSFCN